MALGKLFRRDPMAAPGAALYARIVEQARLPAFYTAAGVPDTLDGRFELVSLHTFLLLHRLKREGEAGTQLAQSVVDAMFADMDAALRELGAGDLGVPHRVKRMLSGFYGRATAYEAGLDAPGDGLADALRRNLYGTLREDQAGDDPGVRPGAVAAYMRAAAAELGRQPAADLLAGRIAFPAPAL
jgi:cytochrome b pre-mRNA-processing protein 3